VFKKEHMVLGADEYTEKSDAWSLFAQTSQFSFKEGVHEKLLSPYSAGYGSEKCEAHVSRVHSTPSIQDLMEEHATQDCWDGLW
jgi:hypothetical protein